MLSNPDLHDYVAVGYFEHEVYVMAANSRIHSKQMVSDEYNDFLATRKHSTIVHVRSWRGTT